MSYQTVSTALTKWASRPLNKLPREVQAIARAYIPKWQTLTPTQRRERAIEVDRQRGLKSQLRLNQAKRKQQDMRIDPAEDAYWFDLVVQIQDKEREVLEWEQTTGTDAINKQARDSGLLKAREELAALEQRYKEPYPAPAQTSATHSTAVGTPTEHQYDANDYLLLATREQLIEAFWSFTGMDASWFDNLKDTPALLAARKVAGRGGRGHIEEPMFNAFEVLQWLTNKARRKGRPLPTDKGWDLFERHFPRAYAAYSTVDPRTD
jgi:hypothetical protein